MAFDSNPWALFVCCVSSAFIWGFWRAKQKSPLVDLPGPPPESFLLGNLRQLMREQVGIYDVKWQEKYGMVARIKAPLGNDRLWISDPKAIQYILQTARYTFVKPYAARFALNAATGPGVNGAEGENHYRQRRILLPAFGSSESRIQMPIFRECAYEVNSLLVQEFRSRVDSESHSGGFREENTPEFLSRAILNALGLAAFNYDFRDDGNDKAELSASLRDFMAKGFGLPSNWKVFCQGVMVHVPPSLLNTMIYLPTSGLAFLRRHVRVSNDIAQKLILSRSPEMDNGKDALSRIVVANRSESGRWRLSHDELSPQLATLLGAGYETTVTSLTWILFELATHPEEQQRLREEVYASRATYPSENAGIMNLDALPLLNAVIKESLRFDTVVPHLFREAVCDEVVPLSVPVYCKSGNVINELHIPKGTHIIVSDVAYHRNKEIWGEDADMGTVKATGANVGVWANLISFGAGHRACLGWRFAVTELQAFLFELIAGLQFELTEMATQIRRENCLVMLPMVEGDERRGNQLPLKISLVDFLERELNG
ncbi:cytochrome P450 [Lactarius psammicola]|nr:cytochrome P450 [Lactarius psammicola]